MLSPHVPESSIIRRIIWRIYSGIYHSPEWCSWWLDLPALDTDSPHKKVLGCYRALFSSGFLLHKRRCMSRRWTKRPNHRPPLQKRFLLDSQFLRFSDLTTAVEVAPLVLGIISWARFSIRRGWRAVTGSLSGHETSWGNNDVYQDETWGTTRLDQENRILGKKDKIIRAGLSITSTLLTARPVVRPSAPCPVCGWGNIFSN